jgi:branched-chain amino acid aminotransferase
MPQVVYLNGKLVPAAEAAVSVYDGGWLHGAGLFETMRAHRGRVFRLDAHLDRLMDSAARLLFPIERPDLPLTIDFEALLRENELPDARVRLTVSAGSMREGAQQGDRPRLTVCVTASPLNNYPAELYAQGISVTIARCRQSALDPLAGHKTINYLPRLIALREAQAHRCAESLWFTPENLLAEGSISNVFVVKAGAIQTPPRDAPVLPGITRAVIMELARRESIDAREAALTINDLLDADEVFLTNSGMEVMPVIRVEKRDIADGKPGELSRRLLTLYRDQLGRECVGA